MATKKKRRYRSKKKQMKKGRIISILLSFATLIVILLISNGVIKFNFETYGSLDSLGRCTYAYANVYTDLLPTGERESIASVKPTGWHQNKYDFVDQGSLYNRCHLIAYSLTGENANEKNLVTGTRYMNTDGMGSFEKQILETVREKKIHVLYRVTPVFKGNNLLCDGVHMEAYSIEDNGKSVSFNVFAYNVQPGVAIDYASGNNKAAA